MQDLCAPGLNQCFAGGQRHAGLLVAARLAGGSESLHFKATAANSAMVTRRGKLHAAPRERRAVLRESTNTCQIFITGW